MHIYAFGSVCRGEVDAFSDIDLLALTKPDESDKNAFKSKDYSVYSYQRIKDLWSEGNPFAWHLHLESKMIHSTDGSDYLRALGSPNKYKKGLDDCQKFYEVFNSSRTSIQESSYSEIFDLSSIFLSIRNIATCFSLATNIKNNFSRKSALNLSEYSLPVEHSVFDSLERARMLCIRGTGEMLKESDVFAVKKAFSDIEQWMLELITKISEEQFHDGV